jgi:hypothetical protein
MAQQPKKRKRKVKRKVRITQKAAIVRKDSVQRDTVRNDTLRNAPTITVLPTNGVTFKVKLRKK